MSRKVEPRAKGIAEVERELTAAAAAAVPALSNPRVANGLAEAIGYPGGGSLSQFRPPSDDSESISDLDTIQVNLRNSLISNQYMLLSQAYAEIGLIQTVVNVPVDDALKGGVEIKSGELNDDDIKELKKSLQHNDDLVALAQSCYWQRLYGGGAMIIITEEDPKLPFDMKEIEVGDTVELRPVDMWELFGDRIGDESTETKLEHEHKEREFYRYYNQKIHCSRVIRLKGIKAPSKLQGRVRGWGLSVVEALIRSLNQYLKATDLAFEVLDEFKLDIYLMAGLTAALATPDGNRKIRERVAMANWQKSYQNALLLDAADKHESKQLSFAGLAEAMSGIRMQVAADLRIPLTKLFGISAAGFSSGEEDIAVYNAMVESQIRHKLRLPAHRIVEIRCQQLFGFVPEDLEVSFKPLRELTSIDEETVKTQKFSRLIQAKERGEITTKEFREACNKGALLDIVLNTDDDDLEALAEEQPETGKEESSPKDAPEPENTPSDNDPPKPALKVVPNSARNKDEPVFLTPEQLRRALRASDIKVVVGGVEPFSAIDRVRRVVRNSAEFDRASYEADGGDNWIDPRRQSFFESPTSDQVDMALWQRAIQASEAALGERRWQFIAWWYKKQGGKFK